MKSGISPVTYPIFTCPGYRTDDGFFAFHVGRKQLVSKGRVDALEVIYELCNGYRSRDEVAAQSALRAGLPAGEISELLEGLVEVGLVGESGELGIAFHRLTKNPPLYGKALTLQEVAALWHERSTQLDTFGNKTQTAMGLRFEGESTLPKRSSCRAFASAPVSVEVLLRVLAHALDEDGLAVPSAGDLRCVRAFVWQQTTSTDGLDTGVWEWRQRSCELVPTRLSTPSPEDCFALDSCPPIYGAPTIVVLTADLSAHARKYANRGYRYSLLEVGHVAQAIVSAATQEGLATLEYGGFIDNAVRARLAQLPDSEEPIVCIGLGHADQDPGAATRCSMWHDSAELLEREYVGSNTPVVRASSIESKAKGLENWFHAARSVRQLLPDESHADYCFGTGSSSAEARVKAIAEAVERYACASLVLDGIEPSGPLERISVAEFVPYSAEQRNALGLESADISAECIPGSRYDGTPVNVPVDLIMYPLDTATRFGRGPLHLANSSGVAAHLTHHAAVESAFVELVERHALMETWLTRVPPSQVDRRILTDWLSDRVSRHEKALGRVIHILDESRFGIPSVHLLSVSRSDRDVQAITGSAAGRSLEQATLKALHEVELWCRTVDNLDRPAPIEADEAFSPRDHAVYYAALDWEETVGWLTQGPVSTEAGNQRPTDLGAALRDINPIVVPLRLDGPLSAVRLLSEKLIPTNFGTGADFYSHALVQGRVDAAAKTAPHYLA